MRCPSREGSLGRARCLRPGNREGECRSARTAAGDGATGGKAQVRPAAALLQGRSVWQPLVLS